jgi:hypothetical protein
LSGAAQHDHIGSGPHADMLLLMLLLLLLLLLMLVLVLGAALLHVPGGQVLNEGDHPTC